MGLIADRDRVRAAADEGAVFAAAVHDGVLAREVLRDYLSGGLVQDPAEGRMPTEAVAP
jgi:hypothetical protein